MLYFKPKQIPNYASNTTRNSGHFFVEKLGTSEETQVNVLPEAGKQSTKELKILITYQANIRSAIFQKPLTLFPMKEALRWPF